MAVAIGLIAPASPARAAGSGDDSIAVISIGDDAALAGAMQAALEESLTRAGVAIRGAADVAALGTTLSSESDQVDAKAAASVKSLFEEASDAYYHDRSAAALDRLGSIIAIQERDGRFPVADQVRIRLWRAAAFLGADDEAEASKEALAALTLDPDLTVDPREFRPRLKDLVEKTRTHLKAATLTVIGLPRGAKLRLDGHAAPLHVRVTGGPHVLAATAPGYRETKKSIDVESDLSIGLPMPPALPSALAAALADTLADGSPLPDEAQPLRDRVHATRVLIARARADGRVEAAIASLSASNRTVERAAADATESTSALAAWVARSRPPRVAAASSPTPAPTALAMATPRPVRTPVAIARAAVPLRITTHAELVSGVRNFRLSDSGKLLQYPFTGAGPSIGIDAARGAVVASASARAMSWSFGSVSAVPPSGGTTVSANGGTTTSITAGIGARYPVADGGGPFGYARIEGSYESHAADALGKTQVLTSHTRTAAGVTIGGAVPIADRFGAAASLSVLPLTNWSESPAGAYGTDPTEGTEIAWTLGGSARLSSRLTLTAGYQGMLREVKFSGAGTADTSPKFADASLRELVHSFAAGVRYGF